jgi:hypothetical protein
VHPEFYEPMGFEKGRADFVTIVGDGLSTEIAVSRFRPRVLAPDSTARRVVLERGIPIRLVLAPGFELPDASQLEARLYVGVSELPHFVNILDESRTVELRPGADLHFELAEPGEWPVVFVVGRGTRSAKNSGRIAPDLHGVDVGPFDGQGFRDRADRVAGTSWCFAPRAVTSAGVYDHVPARLYRAWNSSAAFPCHHASAPRRNSSNRSRGRSSGPPVGTFAQLVGVLEPVAADDVRLVEPRRRTARADGAVDQRRDRGRRPSCWAGRCRGCGS